MTPDDLNPATPVSAACIVIDALLDGETVDKHALREALDDPSAREYFVDALVLRHLTQAMAPMTFAAPAAGRRQPLRWIASAAVLALVAAGGFVAGHRHDAIPPLDGSPVLHDAVTSAPTPTRIIRLEPGVSWATEPARP